MERTSPPSESLPELEPAPNAPELYKTNSPLYKIARGLSSIMAAVLVCFLFVRLFPVAIWLLTSVKYPVQILPDDFETIVVNWTIVSFQEESFTVQVVAILFSLVLIAAPIIWLALTIADHRARKRYQRQIVAWKWLSNAQQQHEKKWRVQPAGRNAKSDPKG